MKSVTIFADFRDYYFLNWYQTIKTVLLKQHFNVPLTILIV
jgi:hypothetical protein